jgi:hypothetical protein
MNRRLGIAMVLVIAVLAVLSCATSSGTLVHRVADSEAADKKTPPTPDDGVGREPQTNPDEPRIWIKDRYHGTSSVDAEGLTIRTDPDGASVWLNNAYQGTTPLVIENLRKGTYRLLITLEGYREILIWLDYSGDPMLYEIGLVPILGFVDVKVTPPEAEVTLGDRRISPGITPVPVGSYAVKASAFGYADWRSRVRIWENAVTPITVELEPAAFAVSTPSIARSVVNPGNPGLLGSLEVRFDVTAPGSGAIAVLDRLGQTVHREPLPEFQTWSQRWSWRPPDALPDGDYAFVISGLGRDGIESRQEGRFTIDRTERIAARGTWSGGSGLLYVSTAEALPARSLQATLAGVAYVDPVEDLLQAPVLLSVRAGLGDNLEINVSAGAILTGAVPPVVGSVSIRWAFLPPSSPFGLGAAVQAKAAMQGVPALGMLTTDTFANFSGLSLGVPLQLTLGPFSLLAEPAIIVSAWRVDYGSGPVTSTSPAAWMYWKAGLMFDRGPIVAGVSASARSLPFPNGPFSFDLPVQAGVEAHLLLPGTHLLVGGILAGEFAGSSDWYLMGGVSLGLLF